MTLMRQIITDRKICENQFDLCHLCSIETVIIQINNLLKLVKQRSETNLFQNNIT